ncbi:MAG: hypothetical protein EHM41_00860 [Chloroflexi bacterium]|nr:MAG: hypothetical protein EHM41_00860 [Chloroflexota bacterium]
MEDIPRPERPLRIAIGGMIGAGKTTLAELLCQKLSAVYIREPTEEDILVKFYGSPGDFAFLNQIAFLKNRFKAQLEKREEEKTAKIIIRDRTFEEDLIFTVLMWEMGIISDQEMRIYGEFHSLLRLVSEPPDLYVILKCDIPVAMNRISQRCSRNPTARSLSEVVSITAGYLSALDEKYDRFSIHGKDRPKSLEKTTFLVLNSTGKTPEELADNVVSLKAFFGDK